MFFIVLSFFCLFVLMKRLLIKWHIYMAMCVLAAEPVGVNVHKETVSTKDRPNVHMTDISGLFYSEQGLVVQCNELCS